MVWSDDWDELKYIKNDVGLQFVFMECKLCYNIIDMLILFWVGIFGNQVDFLVEESFYIFIEQVFCLFIEEMNYKSLFFFFGIKMVDRVIGKLLYIDILDLFMKWGIIINCNKFIFGLSGSGKLFFINYMVCQYYE